MRVQKSFQRTGLSAYCPCCVQKKFTLRRRLAFLPVSPTSKSEGFGAVNDIEWTPTTHDDKFTTSSNRAMRMKVGLLKLAEQHRGVSGATKIFGFSRGSDYRTKKCLALCVEAALRQVERQKTLVKNRVVVQAECAYVWLPLEELAWGQRRVTR